MLLSLVPHRARALAIVMTITPTIIAGCTSADSPGTDQRLTRPDPAALSAPAPDSFRVAVETSKGNFTILARRDWAPRGVDRFYHLVRLGYFDEARFFRVLRGFMAQFGINGDPRVNSAWEPLNLEADTVKQTNTRGGVTFAQG